jgi:hypothetical protein
MPLPFHVIVQLLQIRLRTYYSCLGESFSCFGREAVRFSPNMAWQLRMEAAPRLGWPRFVETFHEALESQNVFDLSNNLSLMSPGPPRSIVARHRTTVETIGGFTGGNTRRQSATANRLLYSSQYTGMNGYR